MVVDTDVVCASSPEGGVRCSEFLYRVYKMRYYVAITPDILSEWKTHLSRFARKWQRWMYGRRLFKHYSEADVRNDDLRAKMCGSVANGKPRKAMLKDIHLIETAIVTDRRIASRDKEARTLFREVTPRIREMQDIAWVNPERPEDDAISWLKDGAPMDGHLLAK